MAKRNSGNVTGLSRDLPYESTHYLLFGLGNPSEYKTVLDCEDARDYLRDAGITGGSLGQARNKRRQAGLYAGFREEGERYCDFCGIPLSGVEFERLKDGRDRCVSCSRTVVKRQVDFERMFRLVREGMCEKYHIDLPRQMSVKVVSQAKLAKLAGTDFVPTKYFDPRAVGFATLKHGNEYGVVFENGTPRIKLIATSAHELTHIWQYSHWNMAQMQARYGKEYLAVCEGMAKWSEIQYLFLINETEQATRSLENEVARTDVYGYGLRMMLNRYPLSRGISLEGDTPFNHVDRPI